MGRKKVDLTGQRFGKLVVVREVGRKNGKVVWECLCDCGNTVIVVTGNLTSGGTTSCGCSRVRNITGQRFGKLVVVKDVGRKNGGVLWECLCDCGNYTNVLSAHLNIGSVRSCGCKQHRYGTDHHRYNPDLTDEERLKNRYELYGGNVHRWSKQVMERDNYICQVCGDNKGGNLNAHHLNGWNAFPEQRFDLDNGETLCEDCHKDFHSQYGYGDNTREQFDEYAASKTLVLN